MTEIEIVKIIVSIGCVIFTLIGGGIFATNFYFIKMCIDNNKEIVKMQTYCKIRHKNRRKNNGVTPAP